MTRINCFTLLIHLLSIHKYQKHNYNNNILYIYIYIYIYVAYISCLASVPAVFDFCKCRLQTADYSLTVNCTDCFLTVTENIHAAFPVTA